MYYINKLTLFTNQTEIVTMFVSAFTDKLAEMNIDPQDAIVKICAETPKNENDEFYVKSMLANLCACGYTMNDKKYSTFCAGASDVRKATASYLRSDLLPEIGRWAMCGLQTKHMKLAINKFMAYIGLLFSASKPFKEVFGTKIDIRRVAIIPDYDVVVEAVADYVSAKDGVTHDVDRKMVINAFDGFGIVRKNLTNSESCTIRGPWLKAFVQAVDWHKLVAFLLARGIKLTFRDLWGNEIALKDVDMILTKSCFKTADLYESWEQYCNAFEELNHSIRVCVREHRPKLKGLPYQQGQTLLGTEEDATAFALRSYEGVHKYTTKEEAHKLLSGAHRKAAAMYPALMNEKHTKRSMQEMWTTKRLDMLGGRIPNLGYNAFLAPDIVAFIEHMFGLEVKGFLKAKECFCSSCNVGPVDVTRSPHLDNAHVVLTNVEKCPLTEGPTMFINIFDTTTIQLRADYDGDHVWYSQDNQLLDLINRTYEKIKNKPIDWDVDKSPKVNITKSAISQFIINLIHGSEIGLYADALTKMWNTGYNRDVCDWLTYAANVLIDAAKHASVRIVKPDEVKALSNVSLPLFAMYAKADSERPVGDYWTAEKKIVTSDGQVRTIPPKCVYTGSFLDMYSKTVKETVPEILTVNGLEDEIFDVTRMMVDPHRKIGKLTGLAKKGLYNPETKKFDNCGVFQDIAFRHSSEWNQIVKDENFKTHGYEWEQAVAEAARKEIKEWARSQVGNDMSDEELEDACFDIITRNVFMCDMSEGMDTVIKKEYWRTFGDKCVKVLQKNLCVSAPEDDDFDFDECCGSLDIPDYDD